MEREERERGMDDGIDGWMERERERGDGTAMDGWMDWMDGEREREDERGMEDRWMGMGGREAIGYGWPWIWMDGWHGWDWMDG